MYLRVKKEEENVNFPIWNGNGVFLSQIGIVIVLFVMVRWMMMIQNNSYIFVIQRYARVSQCINIGRAKKLNDFLIIITEGPCLVLFVASIK